MNTIYFPGLGIGPFTVNEIAFKLPFLKDHRGIAWYGIIITLGIILAVTYVMMHSKREGIKNDDVLDLAIFLIPGAVIGARLYYVIFYGGYNTFLDIIAFWNGGLAIYGGIIAGALIVVAVSLFKKIKPLKMLDLIAPALLIGQAIGRWGNFVNAEAFGRETDVLWRMGILTDGMTKMKYYHPTFLYESLWNLIGFIIINLLYKKKKFDGQIFLMYITWYGFGRMLIEGLRTDSLYIGVFRISQVVGFICFVVGSLLITLNLVKARRKTLNEEDYSPSFSHITGISQQASEPILNEEETKEESEEVKEEISKKLKELFDESND